MLLVSPFLSYVEYNQDSFGRCPDGTHKSPSGDCERVTDNKGKPRCPDGYHRSPDGDCERVTGNTLGSGGGDDDENDHRSSRDQSSTDDDEREAKDEKDNSNSNNNSNNKNNGIANTDLPHSNAISSNVCLGNANCFTGTISKVVDGDTVDIDGEIRVRLSLVNTPERGEQGYSEAKDFVSSVCGVGTNVIVDEDDGQKGGSYGRMIGLVYCGEDKRLLNQMIIEYNYAIILDNYCERSEFSDLNWAQHNGCN